MEGVTVAVAEAERSIIAIASLIAADRRKLLLSPKATPPAYRLFELLPMMLPSPWIAFGSNWQPPSRRRMCKCWSNWELWWK